MRFYLIVLMNSAALALIESLGQNSLLSDLPPLLAYCPCYVARLKKFKNCSVPSTYNAAFTETALPFICLLSLNAVIQICKEGGPRMEDTCQPYVNTPICPFNYATKMNNVNLDVNKAADYFRDEENCCAVCNLNRQTFDDCSFMVHLNEEVTRLHGKGERVEKQTGALLRHNASNHVIYHQRRNHGNDNAQIFETKAEDPVIHGAERVNKKPVNTEAISKRESQGKDEKTSVAVIGALVKSNTSENSKETKLSNNLNFTNSGLCKRPEREVSEKINTHVNNNKVDDNIHEHTQIGNNNNNNSNNTNNKGINNSKSINNEEDVASIRSRLNIDKVHLTKTDVPPTNSINDADRFSTSSGGKKDYVYGSTMKSSKDEADEDDGDDGDVDDDNHNKNVNNNNDDILENHPKQDAISNTEYESERVLNPKELYNGDGLFQAEDSHFSIYFLMTISIIIIGYIIYHNKNKIMAYALEGRRSRNGRRRPTSASYRKLDCNLEEAIASNPSHASITNVVY